MPYRSLLVSLLLLGVAEGRLLRSTGAHHNAELVVHAANRVNTTRVQDQPNGEAACAYCASTGCGDTCYTGGCLFTGVLKTEKQDMCSAWTWSCGVPFPGLAKPTRGYYDCPTFLEEVENCKICQRQGCGDCYAGKCDEYCHVISFNCGPQKGMSKCSVLMR